MTFGLRLFMIVVQLQLCLAFVTSNLRETSSISSASGTAPIMLAKMHSSDVSMLDGLGIQEQSRGIPKAETGVISLLEKYPGADGRGVKIAILDTGCDLAAAGLTTTSDGKPKYLDFIDCTGDGNVDMNKTVEIDDDSCHVVGLSGRNLTLGDWATNVKELRLGAVRLFHLLPGSVERRLGTERKEEFMVKHQHLIAETQLSLDTLRDRVIGTDKNSTSKKEVKELELMLEQLQDIAESYEDSGPLMDVVMFNDGESWKAVVDLEANGDLSESIPMAPFGYERQIGTLAFGSAVTFCVQVYEDGKVLSIVTDAGSHGTHVAGIATANFAGVDEEGGKANNKAHLNGVAPGAQVLACKIGDGRLGSAETGTGLVRALIAAKKYGCDLINLSYGEPSWQPDSGRVSQTFSDAVYKWGMTVFTSAGNDGPALSSLGSPGALSAPITVGAYVSPDMMVDQYSTLPPEEQAPLEGASYYFSSRGPTPDGMLPDICAPGGAIAPIPRHALQGKAQYHGTSMSSPNACGVAACILSALKQEGIEKCGPVELKRGIINSAIAVDIVEPFSQGAGLISAVRAVDYITSHHGKHGQSLAIDVSIPSRNKARGIYIRDELELEGPMTFGVLVQPRFDHAMKRTPQEIDELLSLELNLELKPSESWVSCPDRMTLLSAKERNGQTFSVRLQTNDLPPGAHFAKVDAIDPSDPGRGAIFQIPITVIIPHSRFVDIDSPSFILNDDERVVLMPNGIDLSTTYKLTQGEPTRRFITVPPTAEWATIKLRSASSNQLDTSPHHVLMHAIPFVRGDLPNTMIQLKKAFQVKEGVEEVYHVRVKGGASLEVCLQLMWLANPSPTSVEADIEFHSLNIRAPTLASSQPVVIAAASEFARLGASAPLRSEKLNPTASLKYVERTLRPENYDIKSGSVELDILPPSDAEIQATMDNQSGEDMSPDGKQIYDMRLRYQFKIEGDEAIAVTPVIPSLFHQIYDSPVDSQLWVLKDSNSQILGYGSSMHMSKQVSLKKGDYTVTLLIRHPNRNLLEQMKAIPCQISLGLSSELACNVYSQLDKASTPAVTNDGRSPLEAMYLRKGSHQDIYVSRPIDDLPSWVAPGDILTGSLTLDKDNVDTTSMKLVYVAPPKAKPKESGDDDKSDDDEELMDDAVFQAKLDFMAKIRSKDNDDYTKYAATLKEEKPSSIPLLLELLAFAQKAPLPPSQTNENKWRAQEVEKVLDAMQKANGGPIDDAVLAQYFGLNMPDEDELKENKEMKKLKKNMEEQRKALRAALFARASVCSDIAVDDTSSVDTFDESVKELKKWVGEPGDLADDNGKVKLAITLARHAMLCQDKKATAISLLLKARKEHPDGYKEFTSELTRAYASVEGMDHLIHNSNDQIYSRFPVADQGV